MLPALPANLKPQTIAVFTARIKSILEEAFPSVCVTGEISSLTVHGSGHVYFTLKDKDAQLPAVMWKGTAQKHRYAMKHAMEVVVCGKLNVYAPHGKYQLSAEALFQTGVGQQDLALQQLKEKLKKLGYFATERKRPLPRFPRRIALVTSPTGAAIRDMLEIIGRRWSTAEIWVCGVRVQGPGAREEIAAALERLNHFLDVDVILLGRGGGSSEDLAAFNEEIVAHAIFKSKAPIVSAVGHEIDVTIADLVADCRAATPSEAAERATPDLLEWVKFLRTREQRLSDLLMTKFQAHRQRLQSFAQRRAFQFPLERLRDQEQRVDGWDERLQRAMKLRVQREQQKLETLAGQLESLSPLNVLARGYSLTRTLPQKEIVRSVKQVEVGDKVEMVFTDGAVQAEIKKAQG